MARSTAARRRRSARRKQQRAAAAGVYKAHGNDALTASTVTFAVNCADCGHASTYHSDGMCTYEMGDGGECGCKKMEMADNAQFWFMTSNNGTTGDTMTFEMVPVAEAHKPTDVRPRANASPRAPDVDPNRTNASQVKWEAVLCPELELTDDGRMFAPGSISWRKLPLSLMVMTETADGHDGAWLGGRIDRIWREGLNLKAEGVFVEDDAGKRAAKLVQDGALTGVSVDIAVREYEICAKDDVVDAEGKVTWPPPEGTEEVEVEEEPDLLEILFGETGEQQVLVVTDGVIGAVTVCPFPAFSDAHISLSASGHVWRMRMGSFKIQDDPLPRDEQGNVLTAAAAGMAPVEPPLEWFNDPALDELTPLTVTPEGRVYGHAADWETCHIGIPNACTTAPHSETDYRLFHLGAVLSEEGKEIPIGKITLGTGHAAKHLNWQEAAAHYDNTGTCVADVVCGEDAHGIWVAGALRPDISAEKVRELRAAVLSGDWRDFNGVLELVALLAVNVPGFPIPRKRALVATGDEGASVMSLVAAGITTGLPKEPGAFEAKDMARLRSLAARAKGEPDYRVKLAKLAEAAHRPFVPKTDTFYSDDQPRDEHGRWSGGGGAESGEAMSDNPPGRYIQGPIVEYPKGDWYGDQSDLVWGRVPVKDDAPVPAPAPEDSHPVLSTYSPPPVGYGSPESHPDAGKDVTQQKGAESGEAMADNIVALPKENEPKSEGGRPPEAKVEFYPVPPLPGYPTGVIPVKSRAGLSAKLQALAQRAHGKRSDSE